MKVLKSASFLALLSIVLGAASSQGAHATNPSKHLKLGRCLEFLEPVSFRMNAMELFSGFLRVSSEREIYVRVQKPRSARRREAVLLVHGLLDSQKRFDQITQNLLQNGHPVIRVDVYGFGKSLINELERNNQSFNFLKDLPFQTNVQDLKDLMMWIESEFRLGALQVVGHSMGGGLLGALAADPSMKDKLQRVLLISPYVYRLDQYHMETLSWNPGVIFDRMNPFAYLVPGYDRFYERWFEAGRSAWMKTYLSANDPMIDHMFLNSHLADQFSEHLDEVMSEGRRQSKQVDESLKEALVTSAIATVKGLRDLNLMNLVHHYPNSLPVDVIISEKDELVPVGLQQKFASELMGRKTIHGQESQVYRLNVGHMSPTEDPKAISDLISNR